MFDNAAAAGRKRLVSLVLAAVLQAVIALVLVYGLAAPALRIGVQAALTSLDLRAPKPPPPQPPPKHSARSRRAARAAPAARRAQAAPVVAPRVVLLKPPPVAAAPLPGQGAAPTAGAAAAGNGSGAGGKGSGTGAGGEGNGDGGGSDPELVGGRIKPSDTPQAIRDAPYSATTRSLVAIDAKGAVSDCRPLNASGNAELDALTCRLIAERFRFHPARDAAGRAVAGRIVYEHDWEVGGGFDSDPH